MADINQAIGSITPTLGLGSLGLAITLIIGLIIGLFIVGFVTYYLLMWRTFRYKIIKWEIVDGKPTITGRDVAKQVKLSKIGDVAFFLRKHKKTIPKGSIQTGKNTFWYAVRGDDEWINIGLEDIDTASKKMGIYFLDKEVRFARTQLIKGLEKELGGFNFFKEYGGIMMYTVLIMVTGISIWLLFREWTQLAHIINKAVETAAIVMEQNQAVLESIDRVCSGGSGIIELN